MDLAPDGFGSDKLDDSGHGANGFSFPREVELPAKDDMARARMPQRPPVSTAASLPPVPAAAPPMPAAGIPPIPVATSEHEWFRPQAGSPAEHPLLRGLLLELPPRTGPLDKAWLDQWLEAARAALELIYARSDGPGSRI